MQEGSMYLWALLTISFSLSLSAQKSTPHYPFSYSAVVDHTQRVQNPAKSNDEELDLIINTTNIAGQLVTRSTPIIKSMIVEGADDIYEGNTQTMPYAFSFKIPTASFNISPPEALEKALSIDLSSHFKNPYVEKIEGLYEPLWLFHFDELRPAYKIRLPQVSIYDLKDIYVDAETKEILKIDQAAMFYDAEADLFVFSPDPMSLELKDLKKVKLIDLNKIEENGPLMGNFISVSSCCQYFTCPSKDECNEKTRKCVGPSHPKARQRREVIKLPTDSLGLGPLMDLPEEITVNTVRCTYVPQARASIKGSKDATLGFYELPIDEPGFASEIDKFSEIQAYFSISNFFQYIRTLLEDDTWCLRKHAMSCNDDGTPVKDKNGNVVNPYKVFVNQVIPDMKITTKNNSDPESIIMQLKAGKGSYENPVVINSFTRMGNAAFIPALGTLRSKTPRADEILSDLIKPYDHNVFFQGKRDFAYDGDVVFHEFMHAVTTSLINKINSMGLNSWGIHSEPGSLNEAWSDYFAAAFTNRSTIGGYAAVTEGFKETSVRNIKNNLSCPRDATGEIHNDSQIWSGALWEIRERVLEHGNEKSALMFDRAVLASLAQAKINEDFKSQSEKLLANIEKRPLLGTFVKNIADEILIKRGLKDCQRAYSLSSIDEKNELRIHNKNILFVPSRLQIGLKNYAPASSELKVAIPKGTNSITLSWRQYLGAHGALWGQEARPDKTQNISPLEALYSINEPIKWQFKKATAIATLDGEIMSQSPRKAIFDNGKWYLTIDLSHSNQCNQKTMYISLLSNDFKYMLEDINVSFDKNLSHNSLECQFFDQAQATIDIKKPTGCQGSSPQLPGLALLILGSLKKIAQSTRIRKKT